MKEQIGAILVACILGATQPCVAEPYSFSQAERKVHNLQSASTPLAKHLQDESNLNATEVTKQLMSGVKSYSNFAEAKHRHSNLKSDYERSFRALANLFSSGLLPKVDLSAFGSFSGTLSLASADVFYMPFLPLVPEGAFNPEGVRLHKLSIKFEGREIPGLRASALVPESYAAFAEIPNVSFTISMPYVSSLNARLLGFKYGQLITELSDHVTPADKFEYNGEHPWSEHARYGQLDQITKPIALTNNSHSGGEEYLISSHPDFALSAKIRPQDKAIMTFFLWKDQPVGAQSLPDFVFQFVVGGFKNN